MCEYSTNRASVIGVLLRALACAAAISASALALSGCNIAGPAVSVAAGPPKVEARYALADVPTVVFIDDPRNLVNPVTLRKTIAEVASRELMSEDVLTTTISPQDALLVASRNDRAGALMDIGGIGKAVGAQQVIYVRITQFQETPDGYTPRPIAAAEVKVLDVVSNQRVFPSTENGWPVNTVGAPVDPSLYASRTTRSKIFEALSVQLGDQIAKVFYKHEYKEVGERLR